MTLSLLFGKKYENHCFSNCSLTDNVVNLYTVLFKVIHSIKFRLMLHQESLIFWLLKFVLRCTIMNDELHQKMVKNLNKSTKMW